jgi:hypothetical protein
MASKIGEAKADDFVWVDAVGGYALALQGAKLVCRNAKGARLASVPSAVKDGEVAEQLRGLVDWLAAHERECAAAVETWMLRSLPVPRGVLDAAWADTAWRSALENAVVAPVGEDGRWDVDSAGFLRGADPDRGLGLVTLDGETVWSKAPLAAIPHPILLADLADFRELATELGLSQGVPQLFRETWPKAPELLASTTSLDAYSGARFEQLAHALGRARSLGYRVRGGWATCPVWEAGRLVEARYWIGAEYPEAEAFTGELSWVDAEERALRVAQVGPVAFSEGNRMASLIHAGRAIAKEGEEAPAGGTRAAPVPPVWPRAAAQPPAPLAPDVALAAGAFLLPTASVSESVPVDRVGARTYRHPALRERAVVRLTPEVLAPGEDRVMDFLGFGSAEERARVALRRRRALGFPGWALVNDPDRASFALEVVKELKKHARRAASKPGFAKEGFDAIGERLGRSVPHFLPPFYEEVGRAFLEVGSPTFAAQAFNKAREAERVHALPVDEDQRRQAFVDFALAGALTVKAISTYARELEKSYEPEVAYKHFRELCIRRTLGGLPPWAGMPKELRALARAAGRDADAEDADLLRELLRAPAISRAPADFWATYRKQLVRLARAESEVRLGLLDLMPGAELDAAFHGSWLDLLDECGALDALTSEAGSLPEAAVRPAAWFSRELAHLSGRGYRRRQAPPQLFALLRRMAARLAADGDPVELGVPEWNQVSIDLDLLDLALELGVPVADPAAEATVALQNWIAAEDRSPERSRDPIHVAGDPRFARLLDLAVDSVMGQDDFKAAARGKKGLENARRAWFDKRLEALRSGTLHAFGEELARLLEALSRAVLSEFPELRPRLEAVDVAGALARTARAGLLDELGWPALDEVADELGDDVRFDGVFPCVVATNGRRAVALGARGRLLDHELRLPAKAQLVALRYVGGQMLVVFRAEQWRAQAYWSGAPSEVFDLHWVVGWRAPASAVDAHAAVELADGGVTEGGRAIHPGDVDLDATRNGVVSDGETCWRFDWSAPQRFREFDPRTGEPGRGSLPAFFEDVARDGWDLSAGDSYLVPLPEGLEETPLGSRDGLAGWRVRLRVDGPAGGPRAVCEGVDGRRWEGFLGDSSTPAALVRFPGDDRLRPVSAGSGDEIALWDADGRFVLAAESVGDKEPAYARGTSTVLPLPCWHFLRPRDEAGSNALRALPDEVARKLLEAAREDLGTVEKARKTPKSALAAALGSTGDEPPLPIATALAAVEAHVPEVTHPRLRAGLAGLAAVAAEAEASLAKALGATAPGAKRRDGSGESRPTVEVDEKALASALARIVGTASFYYGAERALTTRQMSEVASFFARPAGEDAADSARIEVTPTNLHWERLVGRIGAAAFLAVSDATPEPEREALLRLLEFWAPLPFAAPGGRMRVWTGGRALGGASANVGEAMPGQWLRAAGGNRYLVRSTPRWHNGRHDLGVWVLEYAPEGKFEPLEGVDVDESEICAAGWSEERIGTFVAEARERGPAAWDARVGEEIARRTGLTPAAAALLWLGCPGFGEYSENFLPKDLRAKLGLKVAEAAAARKEVQTAFGQRMFVPSWFPSVYAAAAQGASGAIWEPLGAGPDDEESAVARFASAWVARVGRRVPVPAELVVAATRDLARIGLEPSAALAAAAEPSRSGLFSRDAEWVVTKNAGLTTRGEVANSPVDEDLDDEDFEIDEDGGATQEYFTPAALTAAIHLVPYLFASLPAGDPLRAKAPELLDCVRARLASPDLLLPLGIYNFFDEDEAKFAAKLDAFANAFGGEPYACEGVPEGVIAKGRDTGDVVVVRTSPYPNWGSVSLFLRPARARDFEAFAKLEVPAGASHQGTVQAAANCALAVSSGYTALAERIRRTPVPDGQWEANPVFSAPDLVAEVAGALGVSEDGAALYLQTLALAEPTAKAVQTWNGWAPARYRKAAAEIAAAGLVLEAKRERAGRAHFLPGGWVALKAPDLPIEAWKLPLYGVGDKKSGYAKPLRRVLPLRPIHELFAEAWERVRRGDRPEYEEV